MIYIPGWGHEKQAINSRSFLNLNDAFCEDWEMHYFAYDHTASPSLIMTHLKEKLQPFSDPGNDVLLVGQSYGGYWANLMAREFGFKTVLINPAIQPDQTLKKYEVLAEDQLSQFAPFPIIMEVPRMVLLSEMDEVVSPAETSKRLNADAEMHILPGAMHQLRNSDWEAINRRIRTFLQGG